jgi:hypothetical protein
MLDVASQSFSVLGQTYLAKHLAAPIGNWKDPSAPGPFLFPPVVFIAKVLPSSWGAKFSTCKRPTLNLFFASGPPGVPRKEKVEKWSHPCELSLAASCLAFVSPQATRKAVNRALVPGTPGSRLCPCCKGLGDLAKYANPGKVPFLYAQA